MRCFVLCLGALALVAVCHSLAVRKVSEEADLNKKNDDVKLVKRSVDLEEPTNSLHERIKRSFHFNRKKSKKSKGKRSKSKKSKSGGLFGILKRGGKTVIRGGASIHTKLKTMLKNAGKRIFRSHSGHSKSKSKSPKLRKGSKSKSRKGRKGSKSKSPKGRKGSKSKSQKGRKGSKSKSPKSRKDSKSKSPKSRKGSKSKSPKSHKGSKSKSPKSRKGSKSKSPKSRRGSKSKSPKLRKGSKSKSRKGSKSRKEKKPKSKKKKAAESTQIVVTKTQVVVDKVKKANEELCQCKASGDPHFFTYDGQKIDFMGTCQYTLSKSLIKNDECAFNVEVKNEVRKRNKPNVSWVRSVYFNIYGVGVKFHLRKKLYINGKRAYPPVSLANGRLNIMRSGKSLEATTECGIRVKFDGVHLVKVKVPKKYSGRMTGLCGDCNGEKDDFRLANGTDVTAIAKGRFEMIGTSYLAPAYRRKAECRAVTPSIECTKSTKTLVSRDDSCGMIRKTDGPFAKCIESLGADVMNYFDECTYDACAYEGSPEDIKGSVCKSLEAFAADCEDAGIIVRWRSANFCSLPCGDRMKYNPAMSGCQETCSGLPPLDQCPVDLSEGCECEEGFVLSGDSCVPEENCGCNTDDGFYYPVGEGYISEDCLVKYTCEATKEGPALTTESHDPGCVEHSTCELKNGEPVCTCEEGYLGDGSSGCTKAMKFHKDVEYPPIYEKRILVMSRNGDMTPVEIEDKTPKTKEPEPEKTNGPEVIIEKPKKPEVIVKKPKRPEVVVENPMESEVIDDKSKEPEVIVEKPKEPEVIVEKPKEPEVIVEKPKEPEVIVEKPKEPEVIIEKPKEPEFIVEKPKEPEVIVEKPKEPEVIVENPNEPEVIVEKPEEPEVVVVKPNEPEVVGKPKEPEVIAEKPKEPEVIVEKPKEPEVIVVKPNEPKVVVEKPKEPEVIVEKPKEPEVIVEKPNEPEVIVEKPKEPEVVVVKPEEPEVVEKPMEPEVIAEKPKEPEVIVEKPKEPEVIVVKPNEPKVVVEKPKEPKVIVEKPKEPEVIVEKPKEPEVVVVKEKEPEVVEKPKEPEVVEKQTESEVIFEKPNVPEYKKRLINFPPVVPNPIEEDSETPEGVYSPVPDLPPEEEDEEEEGPDSEPVPEPVPEQNPIPKPILDQNPITEPVPEQKPIPEQVPEQKPIPEPIPEANPITEQVPERNPIPEKDPEQKPIPEPIPEQNPITEQVPEQNPVPEQGPEQKLIPELIPEQSPVTEQVPEQNPIPEQVPEQNPIPEPIPEKNPITEQVPEQKPTREQVPEQEPILEQVPEQNPIPEEEQVELPIQTLPPAPEQKTEKTPLGLRPIKFVPCHCEAKGDPHYTTFDNATIELYAECKYTMSKGELADGKCKFDVEVKNQRRPKSNNPLRAFTRYVDVTSGEENIRLGQGGKVLFNGKNRAIPFITPEVNVTKDGKFVLLTTRCGVQVRFDGRFLARIQAPPAYRNRLSGLCGNCNGNKKDDVDVDGRSVESFPSIKEGYLALANRYLVNDNSDNASKDSECLLT